MSSSLLFSCPKRILNPLSTNGLINIPFSIIMVFNVNIASIGKIDRNSKSERNKKRGESFDSPLSYLRAEDGAQTRDPQLGRLVL